MGGEVVREVEDVGDGRVGRRHRELDEISPADEPVVGERAARRLAAHQFAQLVDDFVPGVEHPHGSVKLPAAIDQGGGEQSAIRGESLLGCVGGIGEVAHDRCAAPGWDVDEDLRSVHDVESEPWTMVQGQGAGPGGDGSVTAMRIGELAKRSGVSIDTIRYYERRGVLPSAARTAAGYRLFPVETVERLGLVRQLQDLGFTLDQVVEALHAHDLGGATCESERWRLEQVSQHIDIRLAELTATRRRIRAALAACERGACRFVASSPVDLDPND